MEEFPQFLIVLIFIVVSLLEGIGRRKKAGQQGKPRPGPTRAEAPGRVPGAGQARPRPAPAPAPAEAGKRRDAASSEGLIPAEVWEEILGLARGTPPQAPAPVPAPAPVEGSQRRDEAAGLRRRNETLEDLPEFEARSLETVPEGPKERPILPDERPAPGGPGRRPTPAPTPQRAKPVPIQVGAYPARVFERRLSSFEGEIGDPGSAPAGHLGLRAELFGSGSPEELRKAVILKEVLGPPLALRE